MTIPQEIVDGAPPEQYVAQYGKSGGVGCFNVVEPLALRRGDRVVLRTARGLEAGTILCPATIRQARLLGASASGAIERRLLPEDRERLENLERLAADVFELGRRFLDAHAAPMEMLDVDVLLDRRVLVQYVGRAHEGFLEAIKERFAVDVALESLAIEAETHEEHAGCGKPGCGKEEGGGCSTCGTGGGCSSCGTGGDLKEYFAHLRTEMEIKNRVPLL